MERDHPIRLDFAPEVIGLASQPFWLSWDDGPHGRRHAPDYFARLADGTGVVIDWRPAGRIKPSGAAAFTAAERAARRGRLAYELAHEPDPVRMANLRGLAGYRRTRCRRADIAAAALDLAGVPHRRWTSRGCWVSRSPLVRALTTRSTRDAGHHTTS